MKENVKTLAFVVLAAVALLAAWTTRPTAPEPAAAVEDRGEPFFPEFEDPLAAATLRILEFDEDTGSARAFEVARHDGVWSLPSHENYPADAENQFAEAVAAMISLEKGPTTSDRPADHELYGVIDPQQAGPGATGVGRRITVSGEAGRTLADLIVGKPVKRTENQRYVRVPGRDRVYQAILDVEKFSTNFEEWIEKDLLQLTVSDITGVVINDYSIDEIGGRIVQGETLRLGYDSEEFKWSLEGLGEDEELDNVKLNALRRALDQLEIVDVHRKPAGLSAELQAEDTLELDSESVRSLRSRGFYIVQGRLLSNQGETIIRTSSGVQYTLRFGEIALVEGRGTDDEAEGEDAGDGDEGRGRYLFVTAEFDEQAVPAPELQEVPDLAAMLPEQEDGESPADRPEVQDAMAQAKERIEAENQRKQAEYEEKLEAGRQRVRELNARFADWYYVIPEDVYDKVRLTRDDIVKPAEEETPQG